jgi:hypothetical protein
VLKLRDDDNEEKLNEIMNSTKSRAINLTQGK